VAVSALTVVGLLVLAFFIARPRLVTVYVLEVSPSSSVLPAREAKSYTSEKVCEDEAAYDNTAWENGNGARPRVGYFCKPSTRLLWGWP
jgi:hypothetical protein